MFTRTSSAPLGGARTRALALASAAALAAALAGCGANGASPSAPSSSRQAAGNSESGFEGAALPGNVPAPPLALSDQRQRRVSLGDYRGRVAVIAFLYSTCGGPCVLIAQQIRGALDELAGEHARAPVVLIVSADPGADTPAHVSRFLAGASLSGRVEYLTGSAAQLREIWRAYHVHPASAGRTAFDEYASVLLVDPRGRERVLFGSEQLTPEAISHDIGKLQTG
jgi:protein SCO1